MKERATHEDTPISAYRRLEEWECSCNSLRGSVRPCKIIYQGRAAFSFLFTPPRPLPLVHTCNLSTIQYIQISFLFFVSLKMDFFPISPLLGLRYVFVSFHKKKGKKEKRKKNIYSDLIYDGRIICSSSQFLAPFSSHRTLAHPYSL